MKSLKILGLIFCTLLGSPSFGGIEGSLPSQVTYRVGAGDSIGVVVFGEEDLSLEMPIDRDGNVHIPYVGRVMVQGLTSQECGDLIELRLRDGYLVDPQVTVTVAQYGARPVQVLGEVESAGIYYLMGDTSILGMLARAGGSPENVTRGRIVRESNGVVQTIEIDLELDVLNTDGSRTVLMSGDTLQLLAPAIVFVSGEVEDEGAVPWRDGMTAWQALTRAGGPTRTAKLRAVYVLRDGETIAINMNDVAEGRQDDVVLRPNDQIVVPESMF
jgi:protein involved in polysaccharide export with SLBB domain